LALDDRLTPILADLRARSTREEERVYLSFHEPRYRFLIAKLEELFEPLRRERPGEPIRMLDVGAAFEAAALRELVPDVVVDSFGFADGRFPRREHERHIEYDLNQARSVETWPSVAGYDLVLCAEVIEHLHTAPVHALRLLHSLLRPQGLLVVQTPNPVHLQNRVAVLRGRNPFERIREDPSNPGHFREYTVAELLDLARDAGFEVLEWQTANYFRPPSVKHRLVAVVSPLLPRRLRTGITLVLRKP
jgi:SAM-dependent methyltransferase